MSEETHVPGTPYHILCLDGGGARGTFSLGVLRELEARLHPRPLHEVFDQIYGTSTGAIIAALLALGETVEGATATYFEAIPRVMKAFTPGSRSRRLRHQAERIFGDQSFEAFQTNVGIVAIHATDQQPLIFKTHARLAHGRKSTFVPGFGCSIADALLASSAAYPAFRRHHIANEHLATDLLDGGFVANNPTFLAIADAIMANDVPARDLRVVSVGTGGFPEGYPPFSPLRLLRHYPFRLVPTVLGTSTNTIERLRTILVPHVECLRIDKTFTEPATSLLENREPVLRTLYDRGRATFGEHEAAVAALLESSAPQHS